MVKPFLSELSNQRCLQETEHRNFQLIAQLTCRLTDAPLIIVYCIVIFMMSYPHRVKMTGHRFAKLCFPRIVSSLNSAACNSFFKYNIGTLPAFNHWSYPLVFFVLKIFPLLLYCFNAF